MSDLAGKVALVTGASRGIGRAIAIALAQSGASVAVNFRTHEAEADAVATAIRAIGSRALPVEADVRLPADVCRMVDVTRAELGPISILVNNAGVTRPQPIDEIGEGDWDDLIDTNLKSCFLLTQATLGSMRERRWGRIINLSLVAAHIGGVVGPHYAASKAGIIGLTHFYASALVKDGVTVNAISPALVDRRWSARIRTRDQIDPGGAVRTA